MEHEEAPIHGPAIFPALESLGLCTGLGAFIGFLGAFRVFRVFRAFRGFRGFQGF